MTQVQKYITADKTIRVTAISCPELIDEVCVNLRSSPLATMALGRSIIGACLLVAQFKENHAVALRFRGNGPLEEIYAEATAEGHVRGYVAHPQVDLPLKGGALDVSGAVGIGLLDVITNSPGKGGPQVGTVEIISGEIGQDIAYYLHQSQQIASIVSIGIHLNEVGRVEAAGGLIIELMQSVPAHVIDQLEKAAQEAPPISRSLASGITLEEIVDQYLPQFAKIELVHRQSFRYQCKCSLERVQKSLVLLGNQELQEMIDTGEDRVVSCEFCNKQYDVSVADLRDLIKKA